MFLLDRLKKDEPFKTFVENSEDLKHFTRSTDPEAVTASEDYTMPHPIWSKQELEGVEVTHRKPKGFVDHAAYGTVSVMRFGFVIATQFIFTGAFSLLYIISPHFCHR